MIRRGRNVIRDAVMLYHGSRRGGKLQCRYADSTVDRVTARVMHGERIEDAWRNEIQQMREKRNPR